MCVHVCVGVCVCVHECMHVCIWIHCTHDKTTPPCLESLSRSRGAGGVAAWDAAGATACVLVASFLGVHLGNLASNSAARVNAHTHMRMHKHAHTHTVCPGLPVPSITPHTTPEEAGGVVDRAQRLDRTAVCGGAHARAPHARPTRTHAEAKARSSVAGLSI